jgi:hypothetical protein
MVPAVNHALRKAELGGCLVDVSSWPKILIPAGIAAAAVIVGALIAAGGGSHVTASSVLTPTTRASDRSAGTAPPEIPASPTTRQSSPSNGTQLGSYTIELPQAYGTPLGPTKPTRSQFIEEGAGDILYDGSITPGNGDQLLELAGGSTPSYQACAADTLIENQASATAGTAFCVVETGRIAGVTVNSVGTTRPYDYYIVLNVTIWQNS